MSLPELLPCVCCRPLTLRPPPQGLLISCNQMCADYLFQQDKPYDVNYDTGDKVIQCGRHNDIFKLWLLWRSKVSPPITTTTTTEATVF
ncbi:Glutamate decarboxylase [Portunus trituberculatus]|uniref:Glutamate decarboxylase n=1 Tax=Portunus trituberculatus TaxID=210409 RepID=A0A5B7J1D3_PORTR|nr:Glutamate decarboxylase [Portunus trituberculatus]